MKRFHVNIAVENLQSSVDFYSGLFNTQPTVLKKDYAKWLLDDPAVNFSLSLSEGIKGIQHLGIETQSVLELQNLYEMVEQSDIERKEEGFTTCCYAKSEKSWLTDPQGVEWELFRTYAESDVYKIPETVCCEDCAS